MAHIDSRHQRRRSKGLDMANISVKGRHGHAHSKYKRLANRLHRKRLKRQLIGLTDEPCHSPELCWCRLCTSTEVYLPDHVQRRADRFTPCVSNHDVLGGVIAIGRHAARTSTSFDQWFSHMKTYFPDTLAGRHALDHVMADIASWVGCACFDDTRSSKQNIGGCTCGSEWPSDGKKHQA